MAAKKKMPRAVARNRKAFRDYNILEQVEAGMVLLGSEVKSLRARNCSFSDSFARIRGEEVFLLNFHIEPYAHAKSGGHDPTRPRKLLLHRREISHLTGKLMEKGFTLVPLEVYFRRGCARVTLGLARGKTRYDKREDMKKRDHQRDIERELRRRR